MVKKTRRTQRTSMDKSSTFPMMKAHYGPSGHKSNSAALPSSRNPGQKPWNGMPHDYAPAPGSPEPTQT